MHSDRPDHDEGNCMVCHKAKYFNTNNVKYAYNCPHTNRIDKAFGLCNSCACKYYAIRRRMKD